VESYKLILDFYGMELLDQQKGTIGRSTGFATRYRETLILRSHNHLRMRRILMHLNNVGLRAYAIELVRHLEKEIYGEIGGFNAYQTTNKIANNTAPLKDLARINVFETWSWYGEAVHEDEIAKLEKNTFMKYPDDFKESIYFAIIRFNNKS